MSSYYNYYILLMIADIFRILPVNDRPDLRLQQDVLSVAAGSAFAFPQHFFVVADPDTRVDQLVLVLSYNDSRLVIQGLTSFNSMITPHLKKGFFQWYLSPLFVISPFFISPQKSMFIFSPPQDHCILRNIRC